MALCKHGGQDLAASWFLLKISGDVICNDVIVAVLIVVSVLIDQGDELCDESVGQRGSLNIWQFGYERLEETAKTWYGDLTWVLQDVLEIGRGSGVVAPVAIIHAVGDALIQFIEHELDFRYFGVPNSR